MTTRLTKTTIGALMMVAAMVAASGSAASAQGSQPVAEDTLARRSAAAATAREHASVARDYRQRAEALEATARDHEAKAARQAARPRFPYEAKQAAILQNTGERDRRLAMQARRAAQEALAKADHHIRLAVEGQLTE